MKVQVEELSPVEKKLSIEVEPARVSSELDRAYAALSRQVKIPGFRPGKAPRRILEQRFREQIEDEVVQRVVQAAYLEAVQQHNVEVVAQPQVTNNQPLKPDAPFAFEARVEVKPKVQAKDYAELELPKADTAVSDAELDEQLGRLRESAARIEPLTDRDTARMGDLAVVDYTATIDGQPFAGSDAQNVTVEVKEGQLVESDIAGLDGVKVGDTKELDYTFPADYRVEDVKGKTARFKLSLKSLKQRITPELNDDFAKEQGADSLDALRAKVRGDLEKGKTSKAQADQRDALLKALVAKNPFEVPKAMVERALDQMLEGALRSMARSGFDPRRLGLDFMKVREDMRERAVQEVKGALLLESVAQQESISATDAEMDAKIEELAKDAGQPVASVKRYFQNPDEREGLSLRLREEKTIEFLKGKAKYS